MSQVDSACVPYIASGQGSVFPIGSDGTRSRGDPNYFPGMGNIPGPGYSGPWPPPKR